MGVQGRLWISARFTSFPYYYLGIATMVRRDMFEETLEIPEIRMWIRCGRGEKKLMVCNLYIPTVKADGMTKKKELVEWNLVRSCGE